MQSVKTLVARLWSPGATRLVRAQAAELIRRKSLTAAGLEEVRHVAGLESLIKLVDEGPPEEKVRCLVLISCVGDLGTGHYVQSLSQDALRRGGASLSLGGCCVLEPRLLSV